MDGVGRQMLVLRDAGLVNGYAGEDRRQTVYQIPAVFRTVPAVLDFGFCRIELSKL